MPLSFRNALISIFLFFVLGGCHDTADFVPYGCDKFLGIYHFLPSSQDSIPYHNRLQVVFVDSLQHEVKFNILDEFVPNAQAGFSVSSGSTQTEYCYITDQQFFTISNDSLNLKLELAMYADVLDLEESTNGDILYIHTNTIRHDSMLDVTYQFGFLKLLAPGTIDTLPVQNGYLANYVVFGKSFSNVEFRLHTEMQPIPAIHYNTTEGIVSFLDWEGKKWRFERFE